MCRALVSTVGVKDISLKHNYQNKYHYQALQYITDYFAIKCASYIKEKVLIEEMCDELQKEV